MNANSAEFATIQSSAVYIREHQLKKKKMEDRIYIDKQLLGDSLISRECQNMERIAR